MSYIELNLIEKSAICQPNSITIFLIELNV